jgi:hypothetical protein
MGILEAVVSAAEPPTVREGAVTANANDVTPLLAMVTAEPMTFAPIEKLLAPTLCAPLPTAQCAPASEPPLLLLYLWYTSSDGPFATAGRTQDRLGMLIIPENVAPDRFAFPSREPWRFTTRSMGILEAAVSAAEPPTVREGAETA